MIVAGVGLNRARLAHQPRMDQLSDLLTGIKAAVYFIVLVSPSNSYHLSGMKVTGPRNDLPYMVMKQMVNFCYRMECPHSPDFPADVRRVINWSKLLLKLRDLLLSHLPLE